MLSNKQLLLSGDIMPLHACAFTGIALTQLCTLSAGSEVAWMLVGQYHTLCCSDTLLLQFFDCSCCCNCHR